MKYWSNPYNHAMSSRCATLNMVAEFLLENEYRVLKWPASPLPVMRVGAAPYPAPRDSSLSYLHVCTLGDITQGVSQWSQDTKDEQDISLVSHLVVINESQADIWEEALPFALTGKTAVVLTQSVDITKTVEQIGNYLIGVQELCSTLALAVSSPSLCQALVNIAEDYFGCYMHITDPSHMLIAYAHHVKPLDVISQSLIQNKFHKKELLEGKGITLINENLSRDGVKVVPPDATFPMGLVVKAMRVCGQFAAYIVFQMDQTKLTAGTIDAIELFTFYLSKTLERRMNLETRKDATSQNFLFHLIVDEGLSRVFVQSQCEMIGFPSKGSYVVMEAQWDESYEMRIPSLAAELGNVQTMRLTLVYEGRVLVLFQGDSDEDVIKAIQQALSSQPLKSAMIVRFSDIYHNLLSTFYAYRTVRIIQEYEDPIDDLRRIGQVSDSHKTCIGPKVYSFRDAFCLYWSDPAANNFLKRYALRHMLVTRIEEDDKEKGTDNLAVLADYLSNERRISITAQNTHMHRNGVIYRIKRIQAMYHIDFDDYLQRQYILTGLQVRISLGLEYQTEASQFPEPDLGNKATMPVRPDIPRDSDYDPSEYMR